VLVGAGAISELALARQASETLARAQRALEAAQSVLNDVELLQLLQETAERAARLVDRAEETAQRAEEFLSAWEAVGEETRRTLERAREWGVWALVGLGVLLLLGVVWQ